MFEYSQSSHTLTQNGQPITGGDECYSGTGDGRNNPDMQDVRNVGPVPQGKYRIGYAFDDDRLGPDVMQLVPLPGTETFGRDGFLIHGNNKENDASHGCLIAPPDIRRKINGTQDRVLLVTR